LSIKSLTFQKKKKNCAGEQHQLAVREFTLSYLPYYLAFFLFFI